MIEHWQKLSWIDLEVPVNEVVDLEVLVIISPRVEKGFSNLDPPKVADEFDDGEDRKVDDRGVIGERSL